MSSIASYDSQPAKESKLGWYLICLTLPFSTLYVVGFVRPYEVAVLLVILPAFMSPVKGEYRRLTTLDKIIILYAVYMLVSVIVGVSNAYESMRAYRYVVLGPVLMYAAIRFLPFSINVVTRAHVWMTLIVILQTFIVIAIYLEEGRRPKGVSHELVGTIVKYSLLASYVFLFLFFARKKFSNKGMKILSIGALVILTGGLVTSASRGVMLPTVVMLLAATYIWKSRQHRRKLATVISSGLVLLVLIVAVSPPKFEYNEEELLEDSRSLERIISVEDYLMDLTARVQFWSWIFEETMEHPIFGYGAAAVDIQITDIGKRQGHNPHHPHNVLFGALVISGLVGMAIMLVILIQMLNLIAYFRAKDGPVAPFEKMLLAWTVVFLITSLTNGVQGGIMMIFFFVLGLMQQVVIYGKIEEKAKNAEDIQVGHSNRSDVSQEKDISLNRQDNILSRKKE